MHEAHNKPSRLSTKLPCRRLRHTNRAKTCAKGLNPAKTIIDIKATSSEPHGH